MCFVESVMLHKVVDRLLRLPAAGAFGDEAWVSGHGHKIEVGTQAVTSCKEDVEEEV